MEYNLLKLIQKISKRYISYESGASAKDLCTRIKKELLDLRDKFSIKTIEECNCTTNLHKKLILGKDIPCMHTITDESVIDVEFPILDEKNFLGYSSPDVVESELEGALTYDKVDTDPIIKCINNYEKEIMDLIKKNNDLMIKHHFEHDLDKK